MIQIAMMKTLNSHLNELITQSLNESNEIEPVKLSIKEYGLLEHR